MLAKVKSLEDQIIDDLASLAQRPYDWVLWAFPWGEPNTPLEIRSGPEPWQTRVLQKLQLDLLSGMALKEAIRIAIRSGHGVGKSAIVCWIIWWAMSTAVDTRGRVTANTEKQLLRTLWPEVAKWHRLFIARDFFKVTATAVVAADPEHEKNWRIDAIPWSEDNPEAFAGLHNYGKRILVICDEASAIPNVIWETLDGATLDTDTQIVWIVAGNPTKASGRFRDCFESRSNEWTTYKVDSREVSFTNKEQINRAIAREGLDSDFVRVRYLGEFPSVEASALFAPESIAIAQSRLVSVTDWEPKVLGVDVARFGTNESVLAFRQGKDARTVPIERYRGLSTVELGSRVAARIKYYEPDAVFIDEGGVGGGVVDFVRSLGHHVIGVNFGSKPSSNPLGIHVANKRAEMYLLLRDAIREGLAIDQSSDLYDQLCEVEYYINKREEVILVSKDDMAAAGKESPDLADALALTFAYPVASRRFGKAGRSLLVDYDPLAYSALPNFSEPAKGDAYTGW